MGELLNLNAHTFASTVARNNVLILFHTTWCKNCRLVREVFEQLVKELRRDDVIVAILDAEAQRSVAYKENVRSFPSIFLYVGDRRERYEGSRKLDDVAAFVRQRVKVVQ